MTNIVVDGSGHILGIGGGVFLTGSGGGGGSLTITTGATLANATQGQPYNSTLAATGGTAPYKWTVTSGALNPFGTAVNGFGPLPVAVMNLNVVTGQLQGVSLPFAETDSFTVQVTDSVGSTATQTFSLTATASSLFQLTGNYDTYTDTVTTSQYVNVNAWNGGSGFGNLGYSTKCWTALIPQPYASGNIQGYPYAGRGWYPGITNICTPTNGGTFTGAGSTACIQISALTKAQMRCVIDMPIDRTQAEYDGLYDMYVYSAATPTGGATSNFMTPPDGNQILFALSVFTNYLDSAVYWSTFIGTANPAAATLTAAAYNTVTAGGGSVGGRIELDGRMWFVALNNENWANTPSAGKYNTCRMFPAPWNEIHQVGSMYLTLDVSQMLRDLLSSSFATNLPFTSSHYFSGPMMGLEADGLSTHYNLSAITKSTSMVFTISTVVATNPFNVGDRVGFAGAGGMTQLNAKQVATVTAIGGSSAAWTVTTNLNSSAFTAYTSGGYAHKAVFDVLDFQTSLQTEPDIVINTVPEISKNISRHIPVSASPDYGGTLKAANAVTANYNLWWNSSGVPSTGAPVYFAMNFNGVSSTLKKNGLITWDGVYDAGNGNNGYWNGSSGDATDWLMGDYTVDANASTNSTYPTTGWSTLATVSGNFRRCRAHYIGDWSAYNWLRINCTAPCSVDTQNTIAFHVDVNNAPNTTGLPDAWFFLGDSHINKYMGPSDTEYGAAADSFGNMVYNYTGHIPIAHNAGTSTWALCVNSGGYPATMPFIDGTSGTWFADFPGRYVWYGLGTNDPAASVTPATYKTTLTNLVNIALSLGKTVIIPSIIYSVSDNGSSSTTWSGYNTTVLATFAGNPNVMAGPDLNTIFKNIKQIAFNTHDPIHCAPYGQAIYRGIVADWCARVIYLGQPAASWKVPFVCGTGTYGFGGIGGAG
jgi:hypothetical protein